MRALWLAAAAMLAGCGDSASTDTLVPDVTGMTVAEAERTLRADGLHPATATRLVTGDGIRFTPAPPAPKVVRQDPATGALAVHGDVITLATAPYPESLAPLRWSEVEFEDGRLTLRGLKFYEQPVDRSCVRYERAEIVALKGASRVMVWSTLPERPCTGTPDEVVLEPGPGWTRDTIAASDELDTPDPRLTDQPEVSGAADSAVLQPDGRTIVVRYTHGGCHDLASATVELDGKVATVTVTTGVDPDLPEDVGCPGDLRYGETAVRLPRPAPPGLEIRVG